MSKREFFIKEKSQIFLYHSREMENLGLIMLDDKTELFKKKRNNPIITKEICI